MANFEKVEEVLPNAKGIAWDTCHKIYILMDDEQMRLMEQYEYDPLIYAKDTTPDAMLGKLMEWYDESCGLRFIDAVTTNPEDPNKGFQTLIGQFEDYEEDEDEDSDIDLDEEEN